MTKEEILEAVSACIDHRCAACPLLKANGNCVSALLAAVGASLGDVIKCSDPRISHEYGRGTVLQVTLQDEGRQAGEELIKAYTGGYMYLAAQRD